MESCAQIRQSRQPQQPQGIVGGPMGQQPVQQIAQQPVQQTAQQPVQQTAQPPQHSLIGDPSTISQPKSNTASSSSSSKSQPVNINNIPISTNSSQSSTKKVTPHISNPNLPKEIQMPPPNSGQKSQINPIQNQPNVAPQVMSQQQNSQSAAVPLNNQTLQGPIQGAGPGQSQVQNQGQNPGQNQSQGQKSLTLTYPNLPPVRPPPPEVNYIKRDQFEIATRQMDEYSRRQLQIQVDNGTIVLQ